MLKLFLAEPYGDHNTSQFLHNSCTLEMLKKKISDSELFFKYKRFYEAFWWKSILTFIF